MTSRPVRIQPRAQAHTTEAYDWYEQQRPGLGLQFLNAVEACLQAIAQNPGQYPIHRNRIRRAMTHRFPYLVFYVVEREESVVLAIIHASRDPRRWP